MMQRFLLIIFVFLATISQTFAQDHHDAVKGHAQKVGQSIQTVKVHAGDQATKVVQGVSSNVKEAASNVSTQVHSGVGSVSEVRNAAVKKAGAVTHESHKTVTGHEHDLNVKSSSHDSNHGHAGHNHGDHGHADTHGAHGDHGHADAHGHDAEFNVAETAIHHIGDGNVLSIMDLVRIPLPTILKSADGWDVFMSNKFDIGHHEDGHKSYKGYVMHQGSVYKPVDASFPKDEVVTINHYSKKDVKIDGKNKTKYFAHTERGDFEILPRTTLDGGALGGGITNFWDFSITKNVVAIFAVIGILFFLLSRAAKRYKTNPEKAPKGIQGFLEPIILFIRDEVAIPFIGKDKYKKFLPFLLSLFFFILGLNLFGQIPFFGNINATGNLTVTLILALVTFFVVNLSGNKDYWGHIFWNPDAPGPIKLLLAPVELMGIFIKPITLMLRLAGNISAGHIAIVAFLGLIFILGENGKNLFGTGAGTVLGVGLTMFMSALELLVAFVQAFVFTLLSASYIGMAVEEHHHDDHH